MNQQELRFFKALMLEDHIDTDKLYYLLKLYKLSFIPLILKIEKEISTKQKVNHRLYLKRVNKH